MPASMPSRRLLAAVLALLGTTAIAAIAASTASAASAAEPARLPDLHWRLIGPFRGGRVLTVTGVPGEPEHFYFGSVNGGVWESANAGRTWRPIFDGQEIGSIGALAVAPSNPRVLYAGTGEADMRSDIAQGDGVYRSADGGKTWTRAGLRDSQQIGRLLIDPKDPDRVYVAALGHPYGPNAERGVFRSTDGGKSWKKVLGKDDDTGAIDLAFEPGNPSVLYAALWQTRRTPWEVYPPSSGPGSGLYKSSDGGETWTPVTKGLPAKLGRIGLAVTAANPKRVYAIVDASGAPDAGGLYRSDDAGASWTHASGDSRIWGRGWYFGGITAEPRNPDVVYSCNTAVYRSEDGGKTFVPVKGAPGGDDYHQLWIDPQEPKRRMLGVDQGAVVSVDGGETWSSWFNQPTGQFYHVSTDNRFPYWVYGSQQDSGAAGVPSRTNTYDGINLTVFRETTAGGESDNVAPDPRDPDILFGGRVDRLDLKTGQTRLIDPTLAYPDSYRDAWTLPLVFSPRDPRLLYFANQRLFRTADGGLHWTVLSPDLTREDPGKPANLDPVTANGSLTALRRGVIYAIAPSRLADRDVWVGTDDGLVWRTKDDGQHWTNMTPQALTSWSKVGIVEASHFDAETAYLAVDRHRLEDVRPYVYRTHDGGAHWQLAAAGIPDGSFVNAVREDPVKKGLLYAGTEKGVYVSLDDGDHWQPLQANLPVTSVRDLDVHGDDLVAATHGRAFWVLDDVTPLRQLRQLEAKLETAGAWLFAPAAAVRFRPAGFTGSPAPKDEAAAPNPPAGANLDYALKSAAKKVTIEIRDEHGGLVKRYTSADKAPKTDLSKLSIAPDWVPPPATLSTAPGMHRFVWPLHYAAPAAPGADSGGSGDDEEDGGDGLWAPPGAYRVTLDVDGARLTQPLQIVPDPRVKLAAQGYADQFALGRRIEEARAKIATALSRVGALRTALAERKKSAKPETAQAIDALDLRVAELSGAGNPELWWIPPPQGSLRSLGTALDKLQKAVDYTDDAPSADAMAGFEKAQAALTPTLAGWETVRTKELKALNARLQKAGQPVIVEPR
jgi:photosystem II stability/assembly factor-like uncharacterized protein